MLVTAVWLKLWKTQMTKMGLLSIFVSGLNQKCLPKLTAVTQLCSSFGLELMVKLRMLLTVFTFSLKAEAHGYEKVFTFPMRLVVFGQSQCTLPVGQSEQTVLVGSRDFVENEAFERKIMCFLNIKVCQHILLHQIHKIMIFKKASYDPLRMVDMIDLWIHFLVWISYFKWFSETISKSVKTALSLL